MHVLTIIRFCMLTSLLLVHPGVGYGESSINVTDHRAKRHQFLTSPHRVVSLSPVSTELLFAVGAGQYIVGRTKNCNYPVEVTEIRDIGSLFPPDYELILAQRPQLIFMSDGNLRVRERLEALKIPVFVIHPRTLEDIGTTMDTLGLIMGTTAKAQPAAKHFRTQLRALKSTSPQGLTVMYEVWPKPLTVPGQKTFIADIIRIAGGQNLVQSGAEDWPRISMEWAVSQNPDVILTNTATRRDRWLNEGVPGWTQTNAIRKRRVFVVPHEDAFVRPGPRVLEAVSWLKSKLNSLRKSPE